MSNRPPNRPDDDRGEYGLGPEPQPGPRWIPPRPIRVAHLEYEARATGAAGLPSVSTGLQFVIGMIAPYASFVAIGLLASMLPGPIAGGVVLLGLACFIAVTAVVHLRAEWTGFLPGVLVSVFLLPVVAAVLCGALVVGGGLLMGMH